MHIRSPPWGIVLAILVSAAVSDQFEECLELSTSCSDCLNPKNSSLSCGWCSGWHGCVDGSDSGPAWGSCSSWHRKTCVGVSIPRTSKCQGSPISKQRVHQLFGEGGYFRNWATIASSAKWTVQTRKCTPGIGCSDWAESGSTPPTTTVSLLAVASSTKLNIVTGNCTTRFCDPGSFSIPSIAWTNRYIGMQSGQVGETSLKFNQKQIPFYTCHSDYCGVSIWKAPGGSDTFDFTAELTDHCLRVTSQYTPDTPPSSSPALDFLELLVNF